MPLTTLTWRRIADVTVSAANVENYLDAIHTALGATTYEDGSARTAGTGRAWSSTKGGAPTDRCVLSPPSGSGCNSKVIVAGFNGARTPLMKSPDTYLSNALHVLCSSNGGTLTTWDGTGGSDPLGAGINFVPYNRASAACSSTGLVCVYECAEQICVMARVGASSWYGFCTITLDPYSSDSLDAESDGRVYGIVTSGSTAILTSFEASGTSWWGHNTGNGSAHAWYLQPGTSTSLQLVREFTRSSSAAGMGVLNSGKWARIPSWYRDNTTNNLVGELRGIRRTGRSRQRLNILTAGVRSMYAIGGSDAADCDVMGLVHA
jgi:hypothetical protein